jgi:hypothetical protein
LRVTTIFCRSWTANLDDDGRGTNGHNDANDGGRGADGRNDADSNYDSIIHDDSDGHGADKHNADLPLSLFAWLISHQPTVLFSHNKPAISNQPAVLFSRNKSAPAISQANRLDDISGTEAKSYSDEYCASAFEAAASGHLLPRSVTPV